MAARASKSSGLSYGMTGFSHARQPAGAHPNAIMVLKAAGDLRERPSAEPQTESPPSLDPDPRSVAGTATAPPAPAEGAASSSPEQPAITASDPAGSTTHDGEPREDPADPQKTTGSSGDASATAAKKKAPVRRARREPNGYKLPPGKVAKPRPRSQHFRFPEEIEGYLEALASTFDCSKTHIVCSAIRSEWQKLRRRQNREAKKSVAAH